jgi:hypothetical protein
MLKIDPRERISLKELYNKEVKDFLIKLKEGKDEEIRLIKQAHCLQA